MTTILTFCFQPKKSGIIIEDLPVNRLHDWVTVSLADVQLERKSA